MICCLKLLYGKRGLEWWFNGSLKRWIGDPKVGKTYKYPFVLFPVRYLFYCPTDTQCSTIWKHENGRGGHWTPVTLSLLVVPNFYYWDWRSIHIYVDRSDSSKRSSAYTSPENTESVQPPLVSPACSAFRRSTCIAPKVSYCCESIISGIVDVLGESSVLYNCLNTILLSETYCHCWTTRAQIPWCSPARSWDRRPHLKSLPLS